MSNILAPLTDNVLFNGRYILMRWAGRGGIDRVSKAIDNQSQRKVAINECLLNNSRLRRIFERDDLTLSHSNLPRIFDHFSDGGIWRR